MELIERTFEQVTGGFLHTVKFTFENRSFFAIVSETEEETFVQDCYVVLDHHFPIDIPKYFGEFSGDVFTFIYNNIQSGLAG
jgi:hypothetical protein